MYIDLVTIDLCPGQGGGGGVDPSGTLEISGNGLYDVYSYASASVSVHPSNSLSETYTSNGAKTITGEFNGGTVNVDVHPSNSLSETYTSNGTYNISGEFNGGLITVEVPSPQFITETLSVSSNGTYIPSVGVDGFSEVVVDVPQSVTGYTEKEITEGVQIVNLSNSASYVHPYVFEKDIYLQTVYLPNCTNVGEQAFALCQNLSSVYLPNTKIIETGAFSGCSGISNVNIQNCEIIYSYAFSGCSNIQSVDLPVIKEIRASVFTNCVSLSYVNISNYSGEIKAGTFMGCSNLLGIDIPNVKVFENYAFNNCSRLSYINADISFIAQQVFGNCGFTEINLSNVYNIGGNAFANCSSLTTVSLNMTNYVWFSYNNMFNNCSNIQSIYVQSWLYDRYVSAPGWSSFADKFISVPTLSMLSYSDGLLYGQTRILDYSFNSQISCSYMSVISVSLPMCESIIQKVGTQPPQYALRNECKNMTNLYLGSLSYVPTSFLQNHSKINYVDLPVCSYVGDGAFKNCRSLSIISLPVCEYLGSEAFYQCSNIQSIDLPVCSYIDYSGFAVCSNLQSVSLPVCEYLGSEAFYQCSNIQSIDLPVCSYIGNFAFLNASILDTVILRSNSVCTLNGNVFQNTRIDSRYSDGFVYVPASLVDAYKSAPGWSSISSKILPIE